MGHTAADDAEWHMKLKKNRTNHVFFYFETKKANMPEIAIANSIY
jgi:hypothetical protein